ncbi:MAG: hypothetical protein VYA69_05590 [Gemmatimonadota bacterium]|nr:hypothetical protein [Gemmatimonadota bacterium]
MQAEDARRLLETATRIVVAKGKRVDEFSVTASANDKIIEAMLGPTGNLRAPAMRVENLILVGFHENVFSKAFG